MRILELARLAWALPVLAQASLTWAQDGGDRGRGLAYAEKACAQCHAVRADQKLSPHPGTATFKAIANTPGMTGTALAVWLRSTHKNKSMPDLMIEPQDRADVIAYIVSLKD